MTFNKYEGLLGSVKKANKFANRMNAIVTAVREAGHPVCSRDLRGLCPNPNYYLDMLTEFGVLSVETRAEEFIEIKEEEYIYRDEWIKENDDGTVSYLRWGKWRTIHNATVEFRKGRTEEWNTWHVTGYQSVQVKRKYWTWRV